MEVPICYPSIVDRVYQVTDSDIYERDAKKLKSPGKDSVTAASISELTDGTVIVSSPLDTEQISLTKLQKNNAPIVIHLDFMSCKSIQVSNIVKIHAFRIVDGSIQVVIVSSAKVFMTLRFEDDFFPVGVPSRTGLVPVRLYQLVSAESAALLPGQVDTVSADQWIVADAARLFTIDLRSGSKQEWDSECISSGRGLHHQIANVFFGRLETEFNLEAIAGLCVYENRVFTLHSNQVVHLWVLDDDHLPVSFHLLPAKNLPDSSAWEGDAINSIYMMAAEYHASLVLCIHIQCSHRVQDPFDIDDDSWRDSSASSGEKNVIVLVECPLNLHDTEDYEQNVYSIRLQTPPDTRYLVDMQFDPRSERCQMKACFQTEAGARFVVYPPSSVDMVTKKYQTIQHAFLDETVQEERRSLGALKFNQLDDGTLEELLYQVDRKYLQALFRPCFARGSGSILPPSAAHIRQAIGTLASWSMDTENLSIEVCVHRFMRQWRLRDRRTLMSPSAKASTTLALTNTSANKSLYESLVMSDDEEDTLMVTDTHQEEDDSMEKKIAVEDYERRWRTLLVEISKQEKSNAACALFLPVASGNEFIIVRPTCITSVPINAAVTQRNDALLQLDVAALQLENILERSNDGERLVAEAQAFAFESISQGRVASSPDTIGEFVSILGQLRVVPTAEFEDALAALERELNNRGEESVEMLYNAPLEHHFVLLEFLRDWNGQVHHGTDDDGVTYGRHDRIAAGSLFMRCLDSSRLTLLCRYVVLKEFLSGFDEAANLALRMYFQTVTLSCIACHKVPYPRTEKPQPGYSPPKRTKPSAVVYKGGTSDKASVLESLLIQIGEMSEGSFFGSSIAHSVGLAVAALQQSLQLVRPQDCSDSKPFPALGMLNAEDGLTDQPWLASLLLAPAVSIPIASEPQDLVQKREQVFADMLLRVASTKENGTKLLGRAFGLLRFDISDIPRSVNYMETLKTRIVDGKCGKKAAKLLLQYILDAIETIDSEENDGSDAEKGRFYFFLLRVAASVGDYDVAFESCLNYPDRVRRLTNFKWLVREMVQNGDLDKLLEICLSKKVDKETFQMGLNLGEIAVDTLSEDWKLGIYALKADPSNKVVDCVDALYALHASQGNWRRSAQCMDSRYLRALAALGKSAPELSRTLQKKRIDLIVEDLQRSSTACYLSLTSVEDEKMRYIVSGKEAVYPSVPFAMSGHGDKHDRSGSPFSVPPREGEPETNEQLMDLDATHQRAARSVALHALYVDGHCSLTFIRAAFENPHEVADQKVLEQLCVYGLFQQALSFADVLGKTTGNEMPGGLGIREQLLEIIALQYMVPLAFGTDNQQTYHSLKKIEAAVDFLKEPGSMPCLLSGGSRSKKQAAIGMAEIQSAAFELLRVLVTANVFLAKQVAMEILLKAECPHVLPAWLEELLLFGTDRADLPGLFARRQKPGNNQYLGDPASLLNMYTRNGLYCEAADVVTSILAGPTGNYRQDIAPLRLPEKGELDFVPYDKIDMLHALMELEIQSGRQTKAGNAKLEDSRMQLIQSLEKHFAMLAISQDGLLAARALQ